MFIRKITAGAAVLMVIAGVCFIDVYAGSQKSSRSMLVLKNGIVLYDYVFVSVIGEKASINYSDADGARYLVNVPISLLPDEFNEMFSGKAKQNDDKSAVPGANWKSGMTLREQLILASQFLAHELNNNKNNELVQKRKTVQLMNEIRELIARAKEKISYKEIASNDSGVLVRVTGVSKGGNLHTNDLVFIRGFKLTECSVGAIDVYPTGDFINYEKYTVPIYAVSDKNAVVTAGRFMRDCIDDPVLDDILLKVVGDDETDVVVDYSRGVKNDPDAENSDESDSSDEEDDDDSESEDDDETYDDTEEDKVVYKTVYLGSRPVIIREPGPRLWRPFPYVPHHRYKKGKRKPKEKPELIHGHEPRGKHPVIAETGKNPKKTVMKPKGKKKNLHSKRPPFQHNRMPISKSIISKGKPITNYGMLPREKWPGTVGRR